MFKDLKKVIDLKETQQVWAHPGESISMEIDFDRDISNLVFKMNFNERQWSFSPYTYTFIEPTTNTSWLTVNGEKLNVEIPESETLTWKDKTIEFQICVSELDGTDWVTVDGTITVSGGV